MAFRYIPAKPTVEDVASGRARLNNRQLLKMMKALVETMDRDSGIAINNHEELMDAVLAGDTIEYE